MKRPKAKTLIRELLKSHEGWISKGDLIAQLYNEGHSTDSISRRARELAEAGDIKVDYYTGKYNQQLARYASLKVEKPKIPKIEIKEIDGRMVAVIV